MADRILPHYPVYVISKGRWENPLTANALKHDGVPFHIVVEPQEADAYREAVGPEHVLVLPFSNLGLGSIPARNWVWEHAKDAGHERHWTLDDNIRGIYRRYRGKRIYCAFGVGLRAAEDFTDRYENIAISGLNYDMFAPENNKLPPFFVNHRVYSCLLIRNDLPYRWRGRYNEDTDLCLQVLSGGWCTVLVNAFLIKKVWTMAMKGGNTDELYKGDGRLKMARALERKWPGVVETDRRFQRPQHRVKDEWRFFDTPLIRKPDVDLEAIAARGNAYEVPLKAVGDVKSPRLRALIEETTQEGAPECTS